MGQCSVVKGQEIHKVDLWKMVGQLGIQHHKCLLPGTEQELLKSSFSLRSQGQGGTEFSALNSQNCILKRKSEKFGRGRQRQSQQADGLVATRAGLRQEEGDTQKVSSIALVVTRQNLNFFFLRERKQKKTLSLREEKEGSGSLAEGRG